MPTWAALHSDAQIERLQEAALSNLGVSMDAAVVSLQ